MELLTCSFCTISDVKSGRKRTTRSETAEYLNAEEGNAPQYLIDLLTPLTAMMGTIEDFLAGGGHPPPPSPKQSVFPVAAVIAPANEQENSMRNFGSLHLSLGVDIHQTT